MAKPIADSTISGFYSAAVGRCGWNEPLTALANHLGLWCVRLIGFEPQSGAYLFSHEGGHPCANDAALDYVREYHACNPRVPHFLALRPDQWMHDQRIFEPHFIGTHPFFQDFLLPHGGGYLSATKLHSTEREIVAIGAIRPSGKQALSDDEIEVLDGAVHHLKEALKIRHHVRESIAQSGIAAPILEKFNVPMLLIDERAAIVFRNSAAARHLKSEEAWLDLNGYFVSRYTKDTAALKASITDFDFAPVPGRDKERAIPIVTRARDGSNIVAFLSPVRPNEVVRAFGPAPLILVSLFDPRASPSPDPTLVRDAFAFTPAEAAICVSLANGNTVEEISARRQVAVATVRTQVRSALNKVGVRRQSELVSLASRMASMGINGR